MREEVSCVRVRSVSIWRIRNPGACPAAGWPERKGRETELAIGSACRRRKSGHRIRASAKMKCCGDSSDVSVNPDSSEPPQHKSDRNISGQMLRATFAHECGQRGGRRTGVVHGLSTRPAGRGPARRARPQIHMTLPDRAMDEARGIPFQAATAPASRCRVVTSFFSLLSERLGTIRGCSRQNVAVPRRAQRRVHTLIRFGWPALAGRVTMMPDSGDATFREAGPI